MFKLPIFFNLKHRESKGRRVNSQGQGAIPRRRMRVYCWVMISKTKPSRTCVDYERQVWINKPWKPLDCSGVFSCASCPILVTSLNTLKVKICVGEINCWQNTKKTKREGATVCLKIHHQEHSEAKAQNSCETLSAKECGCSLWSCQIRHLRLTSRLYPITKSQGQGLGSFICLACRHLRMNQQKPFHPGHLCLLTNSQTSVYSKHINRLWKFCC